MKKLYSYIILGLTFLVFSKTGYAQKIASKDQLISSSKADTWTATDDLNRSLATNTRNGNIQKDKFVGVFYFVWQGSHGYDTPRSRKDQGVLKKLPSDTLSPFDLSKILTAKPEDRKFGPVGAFHYWSEPYFGYYLPNDEWIIRKHAQMLSDAGVDVIIIDVTNGFTYLPQVKKIAKIYREMRSEGNSTPSISFIVNSNPKKTVGTLYKNFYKKGLYQDIWFKWLGKPLLLAPKKDLSKAEKDFFTLRRSWAWTKGQKWFGDGKDKWPWLDHTPQNYGWHTSPDMPEEIPVSPAEHPVSNIGRSFHDGKEPAVKTPGKGLYFKEQWKRALAVDPEFVFITGWNEWVAQRQNNGAAKMMAGKPIKKGDTYFVDQYSPEYSRDIEPMKGGFKDNYYYQMVDNIRKFKGSRKIKPAKKLHVISMDGAFQDWKKVTPVYRDDKNDVLHRNHPGFGRIKNYTNASGRNDIVEAKVAVGRDAVYFYVKTKDPLTEKRDTRWMNLLLNTVKGNGWNTFNFVLNRRIKNHKTSLEILKPNGKTSSSHFVPIQLGEREIEVAIPKKYLSIAGNNFSLDFKWTDNIPLGDPMKWLDTGDAAPNARFRYPFVFQEE